MIVHEPITRFSISALGEITCRHSYLRENMLVTHVFTPSEFDLVKIELDRIKARKPNIAFDNCPFCSKPLDKNYCKNPECDHRIKKQLEFFLISVGAPLRPIDRSEVIDMYLAIPDCAIEHFPETLVNLNPEACVELSFFFKHMRHLSTVKNTQVQYDFIVNQLLHKDESLANFPHLSALVSGFLKIV